MKLKMNFLLNKKGTKVPKLIIMEYICIKRLTNYRKI